MGKLAQIRAACSQGFVPAVCWWVCVFAIDVNAHVREHIEAGACIGMQDVMGWHLVRLGKQEMGVISRCHGGGEGGFIIFLLAMGSWERTGPYGEGWPKLESTTQKPHQLQRRNTSTF